MGRSIPLPDVFRYDDFRAFLSDFYAARKRADPAFSFGVFARKAGVPSRAHLKLVIDGRRNLSERHLTLFMKGLDLGAEEALYFSLLVRRDQARTPAEREAAEREIRRWKVLHAERAASGEELRRFRGRWYALQILSLSRRSGCRADPRWLSRRFLGRIRPEEAAEAIRFLREQGYVRVRRGLLEPVQARRIRFAGRLIDPADNWALTVEAHRAGADPRLPRDDYRPFGHPSATITVLERDEAKDVARRLAETLSLAVPAARRDPREGELCLVMVDVIPLTSGK